ncbi:hypothetical protein ACH41H_24650 [Streptomyces sp. NPDC020800]|uniref:hypothetical protein n=1 Tax=Streptomyces sp. NPDC020800 TaxID=3365092 RepID=UPI0037A61202
MSTSAVSYDPKPAPGTYAVGTPIVAFVATLLGLVAAVLALIDLFANGFMQTLLHLGVGLAVFGAVRLSVGAALDPFRPTEPDHPESSP